MNMNKINELPRFVGCEEYKEFFFQCQATETIGTYIYEGNTPMEGKKLRMLFVDKNNQPAEIENAAFVEIQELDADGAMIHVEHGKADKYDTWTR